MRSTCCICGAASWQTLLCSLQPPADATTGDDRADDTCKASSSPLTTNFWVVRASAPDMMGTDCVPADRFCTCGTTAGPDACSSTVQSSVLLSESLSKPEIVVTAAAALICCSDQWVHPNWVGLPRGCLRCQQACSKKEMMQLWWTQ